MHRLVRTSPSPPSARFWIFSVVAMLVALGGGSRTIIPSLLVIRPACVLALTGLMISPGSWEWRRYRSVAWLLGGWALGIAVQLVPLPPILSLSLPGHAVFAQAAVVAGDAQPWRPISVAPDLTLNSLLSLLVPVVVLVAFAGLPREDRARTPHLLLAIAAASALLAVVQLAGGADSPAYFYETTSKTLAVGLLANRNHQATLMAIGIAVAIGWYASRRTRTRGPVVAIPIALTVIGFGMIGLLTGSRSGLLLLGAGTALGFITAGWLRRLSGLRWEWRIAVFAAAIAMIAALLLFSRSAAIERLADVDAINNDLRIRAFPVVVKLLYDFFPCGSGFGTFDSVFRMSEPDALLSPLYFNNAHDDYLEILLTGGLPALFVLAGTMMWIGRQAFAMVGSSLHGQPEDRLLARLGLAVTVLLAAASVTDYPLRTPIMALVGSIAICWLASVRVSVALVSPRPLR